MPADASDKITIIFQYLSKITKVVIVVVVSKSTTQSRKKSATSYKKFLWGWTVWRIGANFILHPLIHTLPTRRLTQNVGSILK